MPKNKGIKVTPFTMFMKHRKNQLSEEGVKFEGGWKDYAQHINEEWTNMGEKDKSWWKAKAERINERTESILQEQCNSNDLSRPAYEKVFLHCEVQSPEETIVGYFQTLHSPLDVVKFPVIHFNSYGRYYSKNSHICVPSEYSIGSFSVKNGIEEESWSGSIIDPGVLPYEVSNADVLEQSIKTQVPSPPYFLEAGLGYYSGLHTQEEFDKLFQDIVDHSLIMEDSKTGRQLHVLFAPYENDIVYIRGCILWLMMKCDREFNFEILKLTTLMVVLSFQKTKGNYGEVGIWNENDARNILGDSILNFVESLGCKWHKREENKTSMNLCSVNIVTRSMYMAVGSLCSVYGIKCVGSSHMADTTKKDRFYTGPDIVGKLEFQQRFGLVEIDEKTRKLLRRKFILPDFVKRLRKKYPEGLQTQPKTLIWPKTANIEEDLNYSKDSKIFFKKPVDPPSDDEPNEPERLNWDWSGSGD